MQLLACILRVIGLCRPYKGPTRIFTTEEDNLIISKHGVAFNDLLLTPRERETRLHGKRVTL